MLSYLVCVLTQLYIRAVRWLWQQHRTLLRVGVVWGCSAGSWEPCTSPRRLLAELVCICFCIGPCCGDRSKAPCKAVPVNKRQLLLKSLQEKLLRVTVQPLEQEPHSPCVSSKGCLAICKACLPFSSQTQGSPFCVSVEKENHRSFLFFQCTLPKTCFQEMLVPAWESAGSSAVCSTKHMRLDHFASCLSATLSSPKMRLNSAK